MIFSFFLVLWSQEVHPKFNKELEFQRNKERFTFLKWGSTAFDNMLLVRPGSGIVHQVNLEYLGHVIFNTNGTLYPDSVVGTDSHTTMIDGLGVAGWGVGGIEVKATMLGQIAAFEHGVAWCCWLQVVLQIA